MYVDGAFEGDLIRPLGLLTLYFGYAEAGVEALLDELRDSDPSSHFPRNAPLGQKLAALQGFLSNRLQVAGAEELAALIHDGLRLFNRRNVLVHSSILAGGRVVPSDKSQDELAVTPEQLVELANAIFTWKEKLNAAWQLRLVPALEREPHDHGV